MDYFFVAYYKGKISTEGVVTFLGETWIGEECSRKVFGKERQYNYLSLVKSGVSSLFEELKKNESDKTYIPNFTAAADSLVLKCEYLLREFCNRLGIPTFKGKTEKEEHIKMEKLLDDSDLKDHLTEDDHFFIKFILTEKIGYNLRNKIAHGLMDDIEYGIEHAVLPLIIILKLSQYRFIRAETPKL